MGTRPGTRARAHAGGRACGLVRMHACMHACVQNLVHACVSLCMRARTARSHVRARVHACRRVRAHAPFLLIAGGQFVCMHGHYLLRLADLTLAVVRHALPARLHQRNELLLELAAARRLDRLRQSCTKTRMRCGQVGEAGSVTALHAHEHGARVHTGGCGCGHAEAAAAMHRRECGHAKPGVRCTVVRGVPV